MVERGRVWIALTVALGHALAVLLLVRAMRPEWPLPLASVESMLLIDFSLSADDVPEPEIEPPAENAAAADAAASTLPARTVRPRERASTPMQAVIATPDEPEPAQWRLPPSADPFARPAAPAPAQGFGRREQPGLPTVRRPRIAGEAPVAPVIPEQRMHRTSPRGIVQAIGGFIGGGPGAPVEAPCGGRLNGGGNVGQAFSPAWNKHYGCAEDRDPAAYNGRVELPPGTAH